MKYYYQFIYSDKPAALHRYEFDDLLQAIHFLIKNDQDQATIKYSEILNENNKLVFLPRTIK